MANRDKERGIQNQKESKATSRASRGGYLSARESRAISKANRKITNEFERKWRRKNVPESEYMCEMHDPANAVEFDDLHIVYFS